MSGSIGADPQAGHGVSERPRSEAPLSGAMAAASIDLLVASAVERGASHLHVCPDRERPTVTLRVNEALVEEPPFPRGAYRAIVARFKTLAGLSDDPRLAQRGTYVFTLDGRRVLATVSTMPTSQGESVSLAFREIARPPRSLGSLGMLKPEKSAIARILGLGPGLVIACGPRRSGRTTTLYSILRLLRDQSRVLTIEEAPGYALEGAQQVQVDRAGYKDAFAAALDHDVDVLLVDDLVCPETARLAVEAAHRGYQVLTTMHVPDALSAIARLVDLGVSPLRVSSALRGVVAQRLCPVACASCRAGKAWRKQPCPDCGTKRPGPRAAIFEVLPVDPSLARVVRSPHSLEDLAAAALRAGARRLVDTALELAGAGRVAVSQALRTIGADPVPQGLEPKKPATASSKRSDALARSGDLADTPSGGAARLSVPVEPPSMPSAEPVDPDGRLDADTTTGVEPIEPIETPAVVAMLVVLNGAARGLAAPIHEGGRYSVGRNDESDIAIHDKFASKRNCIVGCSEGQITVRDLKSANGTRVNGSYIENATLQLGDEIQLGDTKLVLCPAESRAPSD